MRTLLLSLFALACAAGVGRAQDVGNRSKTVCTALETALQKKSAEISPTDLESLTELKLPHIHIPCFKDNDFEGLTKLKKLHFFSLFHKCGEGTETAAFGEKVFAKMPNLEELVIESDQLGNLPDDAFAGLKSLKVLELNNVKFARLPKSLLTLPKIETIYYDGRGMSKDDYETLKKEYGDKLKPKREKK